MGDYLVKSIRGLTYDNKKIYLISSDIYAVLEYDCSCKKIKILADFPEEIQMVGAFERILKCGNKIYLFPCLAEDIYYYDLEKRVYHKSGILESVVTGMAERKHLEVIEYKGYIYCVCRLPNIVICIDPAVDSYQIYSMSLEMLKGKNSMGGFPFTLCVNENKLIYPYADSIIIEFLIDEAIFRVIDLEEKVLEPHQGIYDIILGLCVDGNNNYWMYNLKGNIFKVIDDKKIKMNIPEEFTHMYYDGFEERPGINRMFAVKDDLCFSLRSACKILKYKAITGDVMVCENNLAEWNEKGRQAAFSYYAQIDEETFWEFNENDGAIYQWNHSKGFVDKAEIRISFEELLESKFADDYWMLSNDDIENYLLYVKHNFGRNKQDTRVGCGEKIYRELL